jgi:hypothetical protein
MTLAALSLYRKGKSQNKYPLVAAVAIFSKRPPNAALVEAPPGTNVLKLHDRLRKAESMLAIQLRMVANGLDDFLFQTRVPSMASPFCSCSRGRRNSKACFYLLPPVL